MEKGIAEIILGYRVDELVGPIVVIGLGGILSEIYNDKSIRIAPVDFTEAKKMIKEVKSLVTITGYRGLPEVDINIIATAIVNISKFALVKEIKEAEINPVIVKKNNEGIVAVDGLITLKWYFFKQLHLKSKIYLHVKEFFYHKLMTMSFEWL